MGQLIDALEYKPDNFKVAPKEEWTVLGIGNSKRSGTQPRFCLNNCPDYLADKDKKCGRFYECDKYVFDMHKIEKGERLLLVVFATEEHEPFDGLSWWVSEKQLVETMGKRPNGKVDLELGKKIVDAMISEYTALQSTKKAGIIIE